MAEKDNCVIDYFTVSEKDSGVIDYFTVSEKDSGVIEYFAVSEKDSSVIDYFTVSEKDSGVIDYFTVSLHSPICRQFACRSGCVRKLLMALEKRCQTPLLTWAHNVLQVTQKKNCHSISRSQIRRNRAHAPDRFCPSRFWHVHMDDVPSVNAGKGTVLSRNRNEIGILLRHFHLQHRTYAEYLSGMTYSYNDIIYALYRWKHLLQLANIGQILPISMGFLSYSVPLRHVCMAFGPMLAYSGSYLCCESVVWSLKWKWHFDEIFITNCAESCRNDNFQCSQWWKFH